MSPIIITAEKTVRASKLGVVHIILYVYRNIHVYTIITCMFAYNSQVHCLALEMVADGVSLDYVQLILSLANTVNPHKINIVSVVNQSVASCLKQLEQEQ